LALLFIQEIPNFQVGALFQAIFQSKSRLHTSIVKSGVMIKAFHLQISELMVIVAVTQLKQVALFYHVYSPSYNVLSVTFVLSSFTALSSTTQSQDTRSQQRHKGVSYFFCS